MKRPDWVSPLGVVLAGSFFFRVPALINARGINSDAAIVGLQAMHVLRGEHAVFLWGSGYQTSVDSYWAAILFSIFGARALVLMLSALVLHVIVTVCAFDVVRRRVNDAWMAAALVLPLIFSTAAVHSYALNPPREASLALAFVAIVLADRKKALASGIVALFAFYADPYALLVIPAAATLAGSRRFAIGAAIGAVPVLLRMMHPSAQHGVFSMSPSVLGHNAGLLWDPCGPWFLGTTIWTEHSGAWGPWHAPIIVRLVQLVGGAAFFAVVLAGAWLAWRSKDRLAIAGSVVIALTLGGFLVSQMVMDQFSMRYLAAIALVMPFVAMPLAMKLGKRFWPIWAPYVATSALCGWMTFTPWVDGWKPVRVATGAAEDELASRLAEKNIRVGVADYWAAYRITFVTNERLVIVPLHASQDRWKPYRMMFEEADRFAYVYDPHRSGENEAETIAAYARTHEPKEQIDTGSLRAVIFGRRSPDEHASVP